MPSECFIDIGRTKLQQKIEYKPMLMSFILFCVCIVYCGAIFSPANGK